MSVAAAPASPVSATVPSYTSTWLAPSCATATWKMVPRTAATTVGVSTSNFDFPRSRSRKRIQMPPRSKRSRDSSALEEVFTIAFLIRNRLPGPTLMRIPPTHRTQRSSTDSPARV